MSGISKILQKKWLLLGITIIIVVAVCAPFVIETIVRNIIIREMEGNVGSANVTGIRMYDLKWDSVMMDITLNVANPSSRGGVIDRISYDLYFQSSDKWKHLGKADREEDVRIEPDESIDITVSNKISTISAIALIVNAFRNDEPINIKAAGTIWIKVGPLSIDVPFENIQSLGDM